MSSDSRSFVKASAKEVRQLAERRWDGLRIPVIYIDSVVYAEETMTVALGVLENGTKRVLGVRQGATENAAVCTALLEDLQGRGLDTSQPTLLVLDGSKALNAAVKRVWGPRALVQRCQVHKKRNVREHLPEKHWDELSRQLQAAYEEVIEGRRRRLGTAEEVAEAVLLLLSPFAGWVTGQVLVADGGASLAT